MNPPIVLYEPPKRMRTDYRVGLSAWTDKSLLEEGTFYPRKTMTPEERLWWYSRFFDMVEVNSTFYAVPSVDTATSWAQRTPAGFLFNVKAFGLLTGHHLDAARLPDALRKMLPATAGKQQHGRVANSAFGEEGRAWAFQELRKALRPLREAEKLGYVLFQLAPWVKFSDEALTYLGTLPRRLPESVIAVEFRNRSWFGEHTDATLRFLGEQGLTYVSIDGPRSRDRALAAGAHVAYRRVPAARPQLSGPPQAAAGQAAHRLREVRLPLQREGARGDCPRRGRAERQGGARAPGDEQQQPRLSGHQWPEAEGDASRGLASAGP